MKSALPLVVLPILLGLIPATTGSAHAEVKTLLSENLITNGEFMSQDTFQRPLGWVMGTELQTATLTKEQKHGPFRDDNSLKVSDASETQNLLIRTQKSLASPGVNYTAKAWVRGMGGIPADFVLEFWDQNDKKILVKTVTPNSATEWQEYTISAAAPDTCTHVTVGIISSQKNTGVSFWDDISLVYEYPYETKVMSGKREFFFDDYRIERLYDVQRLVHEPEKSPPLISPTKPWEGNAVYIYGTVFKDTPAGTGYRMFYTSFNIKDQNYYLCYATSKDGTHWVKPSVGLFEFQGSKDNNILAPGGGTLVYDASETDPARHYKLMRVGKNAKTGQSGYGIWFSPDGLRWTEYEGNPVLPYADVSNLAYDAEKKLYIAATKQRLLASNTSVTPGKLDRAAFISVSKDGIHWTSPQSAKSLWTLAVEGDVRGDLRVRARGGLEEQIYGMPVFPYESVYIGFPWRFDVMSYSSGVFAEYGDGPIQPELAATRDLIHWNRPVRQAILPLGKAGAWDSGAIYSASSLQVSDTKMEVYYGGMNLGHGGDSRGKTQIAQIGRARWRRDGMISLHNEGDEPGTVTTRPLVFSDTALYVNADVFRGGFLKVEVLDASGTPIPGFTVTEAQPVSGDRLVAPIKWDNVRLSSLLGKEVKLKFYLKGVDLYSFWFAK